MSSNSYDEMGKSELRQACKAAGLSYSKLTVAGMREALAKQAPVTKVEARVFADADNNGAGARLLKEPVVTTSEPVVSKGVTTTEREMRNGVKRPRAGGLCADVWAALDELHTAGTVPTAQQVRDLATAKGWNQNNSSIELYSWKRFMGLSKPRVIPKGKRSPAKDAPPATRTDGSIDPLLA